MYFFACRYYGTINQFSQRESHVRCEMYFILIDVSFALSVSNTYCNIERQAVVKKHAMRPREEEKKFC